MRVFLVALPKGTVRQSRLWVRLGLLGGRTTASITCPDDSVG